MNLKNLKPERKLKFLKEYMDEFIDIWPNKKEPFESWLQSTMNKKENKGYQEAQEKQKKKCKYCNRLFDEYHIEKTKDHVIPLSKGGKDLKENRIYACHDCNNWKDNKSLEVWLEEIKKMVKKKKTKVRTSYTFEILGLMISNIRKVMDGVKQHNKKISTYRKID